MYKTFIAIATLALVACGGSETKEQKAFYGQEFDTTSSVNFSQARDSFLSNGTAQANVQGNVGAVCQTEGCWFRFAEDDKIMVDFDHAFTIPMDCKSKVIQATGNFYYDTTSVDMQKEYAKDDKKSQAEIDAITEEKVQLSFRAAGVHLK